MVSEKDQEILLDALELLYETMKKGNLDYSRKDYSIEQVDLLFQALDRLEAEPE